VTRRNQPSHEHPPQREPGSTAEALLDVIDGLVRELHPRGADRIRPELDSTLDEDLRLDSLARVELISRLEQRFDVSLPRDVFADADSPRGLLDAVMQARERRKAHDSLRRVELPQSPVGSLPRGAETLVEVLQWHCDHGPERLHLRVIDGDRELAALTHAGLRRESERIAAGLQAIGVQPGDCVAIMLPTGVDYFHSFYGILLAGAIPVPIYPPVRRSQIGEHLQRHSGILRNCNAAVLITMPEAGAVARLLKSRLEDLRFLLTVPDLRARGGAYVPVQVGPDDIAFIQYTSGSTGNPKGVVLTHANLLANIRVMGEAVHAGSEDVFVSWLPLYHDMGLIGAWLGSLYHAATLVVMSPLAFIARPRRWLQTIHRYRATISASPNFGYELCLKHLTDRDLDGLDLGSWRLAFNGAEQVSPETIERFTDRFSKAGFRAEAMKPVYGLAESSVGLAFPALDEPPSIDTIDRAIFSRDGRAVPAAAGNGNVLRFVSSGRPLRGHELRIVDEQDREVPERHEGALQFKGPSATAGYFRDAAATAGLFHGDWLDSGDLAYLAEGNVHVTGRRKDIIIRGGRNLYPHELEEAIGELPGIRKGCVAAVGARDERTGTERLVVLAETRESGSGEREALRARAAARVNDLTGMPPDEVVLVAPHTVLKTSSGKIRRSACRELYERGALDREPTEMAAWKQLALTARLSVAPIYRRARRWLANHCFTAWAWFVYGVLAVLAAMAVAAVPGFHRRWKVLRALARALAMGTATRILVTGSENLPPASQPCVLVANHASYLDGYVLVATVPRAFSFVAKAELAANAMIDRLLRRMHVEYVERSDTEQVLQDAQRIADTARQRQSVLFFPEGTFTRAPGIRSFHLGAFVTAARAGLPVVPVAIRGTRSMLRSGSWFPRRGQIAVTIGAPVQPEVSPEADQSAIWQAALVLRSQAREHVVHYSGEPDLSQD